MAFIYDLTDTWNNAGISFNGIKLNATDTASAAGSKLLDLQIGGASKFTVGKTGSVIATGNIHSTSGGFTFPDGTTQITRAVTNVTATDGSIAITGTTDINLSVVSAPKAYAVTTTVRNNSGATLTKGTAVYINGAVGQNPTVTKAIASGDATSAQTLGLIANDISNNATGEVILIGTLYNVNTSAYTDGQQLYLSPTTAGTLTATKPYAPSHLVYMAIVEHAHPSQGKLFVKVQNGYEMEELHDVSARNPSNNDGLFYNTSTNLWEKKSIVTALGYTPYNSTNPAGYTTNVGTVTSVAGTGTVSGLSLTGSVTTSGSLTLGGTLILTSGQVTDGLGYTPYNATNPAGYTTNVGTVTSVSGTGTVNGLTLTGSVTTSGSLTLGGTLGNIANSQLTNSAITINGTSTALGGSISVGTVTSVAALTLGTSGTDLSSSIANGTTTPVITLNVPTASAANRGALSSSDWSTFNAKQAALVSGTNIKTVGGASLLGSGDVGTIGLAYGGTGATTASGARTALGLGTAAVLNAGVASGVATLDGSGTVPTSQLPGAVLGGLNYQGTWNASTNTPTLASSTGSKGYYYVVSVAGSTNLNGIIDWKIGDWAVYDGTAWQKVDNTDAVSSVNGFTGSVVLTTSDVAQGTNLYFTQAAARGSVSAGTGISYNSTTGVITNSAPDQTVALTGAGTTTVTGTYPNFTITSNDSTVGTVTSVGGTGTVSGLTLTGTVTTSGNLTLGGTLAVTPSNFASQTANTVLAAPNGAAGVPTFRAIVAADIPTLNQNTTGTASNVTGTVAVGNGGTGVTTSTGTGSVVLSNSPTLVTPTLGAASATSIANALGTVGAPSYTFTGDTNTGIWSPSADIMAVSTAGAERMRIIANGDMLFSQSSTTIPGLTNTTVGSALLANGTFLISRDAGAPVFLNRNTSDGQMLSFARGGVQVGGILATTSSVSLVADAGNFLALSAGGSERFRITSTGSVGIGTSSPAAQQTLTAGRNMTGSTFSSGVASTGQVQSDATSRADYFISVSSVAAGTYSRVVGYQAQQGTITGTVNNQYGFQADATLIGATYNMGFFGNIPDGTNRWNFYAQGTAPNYFAGNVGIGTASPAAPFVVQKGSAFVNADIAKLGDSTLSRYLRIHTVTAGGNARTALSAQFDNSDTNYFDLLLNPFGGNVGIGTSSPGYKLQVTSATESGAYITDGTRAISLINSAVANGSVIGAFTNNSLLITTNNTERMRIDTSGNLLVGTTSAGTSAAKVIGMANATAPTTSPAGMGQLYVEGGALKFRGSSGTVTTIAPA